MAHDVFISYASPDKPTADAACAFLEARGVRCWMAPRDVLPGMDWSESIVDAIEGCRIFVLIFSSRANGSQQIKREVERAVNKARLVVPFRIENVVPNKALEYFISTPHWLDAMSPPLEAHLNHLGETIRLLLERTAPPDETLPTGFDRAARAGAATRAPESDRPAAGARELRIPLALSPEVFRRLAALVPADLPARLSGWEEAFLRRLGPLFGGDRLEDPVPAGPARLTALAGFVVGGLGAVTGLWVFFATLAPGHGSPEDYFYSVFPLSRWLNLATQVLGIVVSLAILAGARRTSAGRPGGLAVLSATSRTGAAAVAAWCVLTVATLVLSANWTRHLAASNRAEVIAETLKATVFPLVGLGSVAYLAKRPA